MTLVKGDLKAPLSDSYYTEAKERALPLSMDCSTLPLILTFYSWVLSKEASSTSFWIFGMTRPGIEPNSPGSLANTLTIMSTKANCYIEPFFLTTRYHTQIKDRTSLFLWRHVLNWSSPGSYMFPTYLQPLGLQDSKLAVRAMGSPQPPRCPWLTESLLTIRSRLTATMGYLCIYNLITPT